MSKEDSYRRENNLTQSIILFVIFFGLFVAGIFAMSFWSLESFESAFIPAGVSLGLITVALIIPQTWIGRSDSAGE